MNEAWRKFCKDSWDCCIGFTQSRHPNDDAVEQVDCLNYLHRKLLQVAGSCLFLFTGFLKIKTNSVEHN